MGLLLYNLIFPLAFLFYLPKLIIKYRSRGGWKSTYGERFGRFNKRRRELEAFRGAIWIHAVSVGETVVALSMIKGYLQCHPERKFVISTTTTTGQDVARTQCPENCTVIFCPIDFPWMVRKVFNLLRPAALVIFETELWPNMISIARRRHLPVVLVNGRLSDHSADGYTKLRAFFAPLLCKFDLILAQSEMDASRFLRVSPRANVQNGGNMKFDQHLPALPEENLLNQYFPADPQRLVLVAASTHPDEERLITRCFKELKKALPSLKLVLIPRHAERGADLANMLEQENCSFCRKSLNHLPQQDIDILLADTTGEMLMLLKDADLVIMGKSFNGHDEGHNLIEPALLGKAIVTGPVLRNFRFVFQILNHADALRTATDESLCEVLLPLLQQPAVREALGKRAAEVIGGNRGAVQKAVNEIETLINLR